MKFRPLTEEEQDLFKDDFIHFLAANGIDGPTWDELKVKDEKKAESVLDIFSDMIFETIFQKQSYLERWTNHQIHTFHFQQKQVVFLGVQSKEVMTEANALEVLKSGNFDLTHSTKSYVKSREEEMFEMMNRGCQFSKGELFKKLALLFANSKEQ